MIRTRNGQGMFPLNVAIASQTSSAVTFEFKEEIAGHVFVRLRAPPERQWRYCSPRALIRNG